MAKRIRVETSFSPEQFKKIKQMAKDEGDNVASLMRRATIKLTNSFNEVRK